MLNEKRFLILVRDLCGDFGYLPTIPIPQLGSGYVDGSLYSWFSLLVSEGEIQT